AGISGTFLAPLGHWVPNGVVPGDDPAAIRDAIGNLNHSVAVVGDRDVFAVVPSGEIVLGSSKSPPAKSLPVVAYLPPLPPGQLGDPTFREDHALKYPYMTGAMANGIGSAEIVEAMCGAGMLGSFGPAGLSEQ